LKALGFEKSEFEVSEFKNHPQVKANRPLSDRTFSTTVEPPLRQILEAKRRDRCRSLLEDEYECTLESYADKKYFPPSEVYLNLPMLQPILNDVSRNPSESNVLPEPIKSAVSLEVSKLIRGRREALLRSIVIAYQALTEDGKAPEGIKGALGRRKLARKKEERKQEEDLSEEDDSFTSISTLPLTLPRLPPWIPRSQDDPILASDEQLVSFLENSPLAKFECGDGCRQLFSLSDLLSHFSSAWDCGSKYSFKDIGIQNQWITIEGIDDAEIIRVKINKDVLSLSLKLQQLVESIPHSVDDVSKQLPELGSVYSLGEEKPDWYTVSLVCGCRSSGGRSRLQEMVSLPINALQSLNTAEVSLSGFPFCSTSTSSKIKKLILATPVISSSLSSITRTIFVVVGALSAIVNT